MKFRSNQSPEIMPLLNLRFRLLSAKWRRCSRKSALERKEKQLIQVPANAARKSQRCPLPIIHMSPPAPLFPDCCGYEGPISLSVGSMPTSQAKLRGSRTASTKIRRRPAQNPQDCHDCHDCLMDPEGSWGSKKRLFSFILLLPYKAKKTWTAGACHVPNQAKWLVRQPERGVNGTVAALPVRNPGIARPDVVELIFLAATLNHTEWPLFVYK